MKPQRTTLSSLTMSRLHDAAQARGLSPDTYLNQLLNAQPEVTLWQEAFEAAPTSCVVIDAQAPNYPIIAVNAAFETMSGYRAQEALQRNLDFLYGNSRDPKARATLHNALRKGMACQTTLRSRHRDGDTYWVEALFSPMRDAEETVTHFVAQLRDITEERRARNKLRINAERYKIVTELMADYAISVYIEDDESLLVEWIAGAFKDILGDTAPHNGRRYVLEDLFTEDQMDSAREDFARLQAGETVVSTYQRQHADGHTTWLETTRKPVWDEGAGRVTRYYGAVRNVTAEVETRNELTESEQRFRVMSNTVPVLIWMSDERRHFKYVNDVWLTFTGSSLEETLQGSWRESIHPDDFKTLMPVIDHAYEKRVPFQFEYRMRRHDGVYRWVRDDGVPMFGHDGRFVGYIGSCIDVTPQRDTQLELEHQVWERTRALRTQIDRWLETDEELRRERDLLRQTIRTSPSAILILTPEGIIQFASDTAGSLLQRTLDQIRGKPLRDVGWQLRRADGDPFAAGEMPLEITVATRQALYEQEVLFVDQTGQQVLLSLNLAPTLDSNGEVREVVMTAQDITLQKAWEQQLQATLIEERKLSQIRSRFISTVSHEFKTPLSVIQTSCNIIQQRHTQMTPTQVTQRLERIVAQVKRVDKMIDNVIKLNRTNASDYEVTRTPLDLLGLTQQIVEDVLFAFLDKVEATIDWRMDEAAWLHLDETLMHQILSNLISNAVKYTPDGGSVTVRATRDDATLTMTVADEGIGIPESDLPYLFDDFFRASNTDEIDGTGLGLAIAKRAVDLQGGSIVVESAVGVGTTFTVTLPLDDDGWD